MGTDKRRRDSPREGQSYHWTDRRVQESWNEELGIKVDTLQTAFVTEYLLQGVYWPGISSVARSERLNDKSCPDQIQRGEDEASDYM